MHDDQPELWMASVIGSSRIDGLRSGFLFRTRRNSFMARLMPSRPFSTWSLLIALAISTVLGCNDSSPQAAREKTGQAGPAPEISEGLAPDKAIRSMLTGLSQGEVGVLWDSLPSRYQDEVDAIVREFAGRMDEEVWQNTVKLIKRILAVLRVKRTLILDNPSFKPKGVNMRLVSENWDELIDLLEGLVDSELSDISEMRNFDGDKFFSGSGTKAFKQLAALSAKDPNDPFRKGFDADIQLVSIDGDDATISLTMGQTFVMTQQAVDNKTPRVPVELRRLDGKWMVKELERGLVDLFKDAHALLESIPEDAISSNRERLLKMIKSIDEDLDRIQLAKTRTQFNQGIGLAFVRLNQLISEGTGAQPAEKPRPMGRVVTVILAGTLDDAQRKMLVEKLVKIAAATGKPRVTTEGKTTKVVLPTQRFLQEVVDGVDFGTVGAVDEVERTLTVTLTPESKKAPPEK